MMKLTHEQFAHLVELTIASRRDTLGCDGCYELMDEFAQAELDGVEVPETLQAVRTHLTQCKCCRDEYDALLTALRAIQ
jgi:hypothetical protein